MAVRSADLDVAAEAQKLKENLPPQPWASWPGGWPNQIELAVLDAVFSIRARYGKAATETKGATGVRRVLGNWRLHRRGTELDDLQALADFKNKPDELAKILDSQSKTAGRLKAGVAAEVAHRFIAGDFIQVRTAAQFPDAGEQQQKLRELWVTTPGLGPVTWSYLCMLLGHPDVKADVMITRYLQRELGLDRLPSSKEARKIVKQAARELTDPKVSATDLDHAIWSFERG